MNKAFAEARNKIQSIGVIYQSRVDSIEKIRARPSPIYKFSRISHGTTITRTYADPNNNIAQVLLGLIAEWEREFAQCGILFSNNLARSIPVIDLAVATVFQAGMITPHDVARFRLVAQ